MAESSVLPADLGGSPDLERIILEHAYRGAYLPVSYTHLTLPTKA